MLCAAIFLLFVSLGGAHLGGNILIFSVWDKYSDRIVKRVAHHKAYADRHGYSYKLYIRSGYQEGIDKPNVDMSTIIIPAAANNTKYRAGWLKVFAFMEMLESTFFDYLFYLDLDTVFYNFEWPIFDVIHGYNQSIILQESHISKAGYPNMRTSSHAVILRTTDVSRIFVQKWFEMKTFCPEINMEQGAMYAVIAELYSDYSTEMPCKRSICPRDSTRKNARFEACFTAFMKKFFGANPVHKDVHVFRYWNDSPRVPGDGFTAETHDINLTASCPLTLHPFKKFDEDYIPLYTKYNKCSSFNSSDLK
jgi:hypothetical protein